MHARDWIVLIIASAALPWLTIQLITITAQFAPVFLWYLDESYSRSTIDLATQTQRQFENLVFAIPTGAVLAWVIRGTPVATALLVVTGYSISWLVWGFFAGASTRDSLEALFVYYHLPIPLFLGFSVLVFGTLYKRKKRGDA